MFDNYPDIITIDNLMAMLKIGKSSAYALLKDNRIRHVKIGSKYIIPKKSVIVFINQAYCDENR